MTLPEIMEEFGFTSASGIAKKFGIPPRNVQRWLKGERECPAYVLGMMETILKNERNNNMILF